MNNFILGPFGGHTHSHRPQAVNPDPDKLKQWQALAVKASIFCAGSGRLYSV